MEYNDDDMTSYYWIGDSALTREWFFFALALFLAAVTWFVKPKKSKAISAVRAFFALLFLLYAAHFYAMANSHAYLSNLRPEQVGRIEVGEQTLTEPAEIEPIVQALNETQWFSGRANRWKRLSPMPMVIVHGDGTRRTLHVSGPGPEEGVLIDFFRGRLFYSSGSGYCERQGCLCGSRAASKDTGRSLAVGLLRGWAGVGCLA